MPHGLGSAGDFGHQFDPNELPGEPEQTDNIKRLEDLLAAEEAEAQILGPEDDEAPDALDESDEQFADSGDAEVSVEELQRLILGASGQDRDSTSYVLQREYYMAPEQLVVLVHHEIISVDEARNYLRSQGIELFG